jgi:hypothetical protein
VAERAVGLRDVLGVAAIAVAVVLGASFLTGALPADLQRLFFDSPVVVIVVVVGTAWILWRVATRRTPDA